MNVLVLGVTGMLGRAVYSAFAAHSRFAVWGTARSGSKLSGSRGLDASRVFVDVDALDDHAVVSILERAMPHVVINCIGVIKQRPEAADPLVAIPVNGLLPHRLARLCSRFSARLVHVSTDCVFSGTKGHYSEKDTADASDLYGRSKLLGEISDLQHVVTLRTSLIGHELTGTYSLVDWFLTQSGHVKGYSHAVFSGLPTVEFARVLRDFVVIRPELRGLYHVSAEPIDKLSLLQLVAHRYSKRIEILPDDSVRIDRSLDSSRFRNATGYRPPSWQDLVNLMYLQRRSHNA